MLTGWSVLKFKRNGYQQDYQTSTNHHQHLSTKSTYIKLLESMYTERNVFQ